MQLRFLFCLACAFSLVPCIRAADIPAPPATPLNKLVRQLAEKRAAAAPTAVPKEQLLRPEFRFQPAAQWLVLPDLARQLTTNDTEREAIFNLLDTGAREARRLLAAEGAEHDVVAATALFMTQVWSLARKQELPEAHADALHAQLAGVLAGPDLKAMADADKQKFWEFCVGFPVFLLGMKEIATEAEAQQELVKVAAAAFESVVGVHPQLVDLGPQGMVVRPGVEEALKAETPAPVTVVHAPAASLAASGDPTAVASRVTGITYTPPAGWAEEKAAWATIYRATLPDVKEQGGIDPEGQGRHAGSIFVLPPRAITQNARTTFEAVWREQFDAWDTGDVIAHYRTRLASGLVIHYMGRFAARKNAAQNQLRDYIVLYLVDFGGNRVQPITAVVAPNDPSLYMSSTKETNAYRSLSWPLAALLNSIKPVGGPAPYPSGGYFAAADLIGDWGNSTNVYGGSYVNTHTGLSAGVAMHSSGASFRLGTDGTYAYSMGFSSYNPASGGMAMSTKHDGRYRLDGDIVLVEPSKPLPHKFTHCAVGVGTRRLANGVKRILVVVMANQAGEYLAPPLVPNWDSYSGILYWYEEK